MNYWTVQALNWGFPVLLSALVPALSQVRPQTCSQEPAHVWSLTLASLACTNPTKTMGPYSERNEMPGVCTWNSKTLCRRYEYDIIMKRLVR